MLKIGIIGCGRIADQHAIEILKIKGCEIAGVCDNEEIMARQLAERFGVKKYYNNVEKFLDDCDTDIIHITTPPQSHHVLGLKCMEAGRHLFMEKPFTLNSHEAENLIAKANQLGLKLTVGYNAQFSHSAVQMRRLIHEGYLGGLPVHMESIWCYPFTDPGYAKSILGDANHWIRSLPGRYLHDILSHGISRIVEFLMGDNISVMAHGSISPLLQSLNEEKMIDELRVIMHNNENQTAYLTFSSQIKPPLKQFRIYGPSHSLIIDHEHQTTVKVSRNYTLYLNHFIPPLYYSKQYFSNFAGNVWKFLKRDFHFESGRQFLINSFYKSAQFDGELPISYRDIILVTKIMDDIFHQIYNKHNHTARA